jgi:hypothetical protein
MSYAATTTLINICGTDALYRTWGTAWNAKFVSMGLVQTADTGQINWTTITFPTVINTANGYEIWRFNDTLQSTAPVFLKIEYGAGGVAGHVSVWITLGSGSNGTGTLTGIPSTRQQITCTGVATPVTHYWSGDTNRFTIAVVGTTAATSMFLGVERTVDATGALTSEGCLMIMRSTSVWVQQAWNQVTGPYTATWEQSLGVLGPAVAPFGVFGSQLAVYPVFHNKGVFLTPGLNIYVYENATAAAGSTISFTTYGATHTYMPLGTPMFASAARAGFSSAANAVAMMRYE